MMFPEPKYQFRERTRPIANKIITLAENEHLDHGGLVLVLVSWTSEDEIRDTLIFKEQEVVIEI